MAVFKCKMCGGDLEVTAGTNAGTCAYCGSVQTLPRLDTEERQGLFERAGHYRRNNDYDKALAIYERILEADSTDPEAYWSLLLCRYGVEYVEDPKTHRRMITCNRTLRKSILADADYTAALANAGDYARQIYETEAAEIDRIQKAAVTIIDAQEPFDVFICYKQTDRANRPTKDSRRAQDIHDALISKGYKVFFSKITLEDKLGTEYEPYIFAALASARVMVVVGTSRENLESPWVKNEWSRFLAMMEADRSKRLIPAYEDMDPYDMPGELVMLQALNMDSFTFVQDLVRGIEKIVRGGPVTRGATTADIGAVVAPPSSVSAAATPLIKRARLLCEDGDFSKANGLVEQALNLNPEDGEAYLVALMIELQVRKEEGIGFLFRAGVAQSANYQKAIRFGSADLRARVEGYAARAKANHDEAQRKREEERRRRDEEERTRRAKEQRQAAVGRRLELFLNGEALNEGPSKRRSGEIHVTIGLITSEIQKLQARRKGLGLFASDEKQELDDRISKLDLQKQGYKAELKMLSGKSQPARDQWKVIGLDEENNRALAITRDVIAEVPYHGPCAHVTWNDCTVRYWLNGRFYDNLPVYVKSRVLEVVNQNPANPQYGVPGGEDTHDKVFLLSIKEVSWYFTSDQARIAMYQGVNHWWWLRSPGCNPHSAALVSHLGVVNIRGGNVNHALNGVRPAIWVSL